MIQQDPLNLPCTGNFHWNYTIYNFHWIQYNPAGSNGSIDSRSTMSWELSLNLHNLHKSLDPVRSSKIQWIHWISHFFACFTFYRQNYLRWINGLLELAGTLLSFNIWFKKLTILHTFTYCFNWILVIKESPLLEIDQPVQTHLRYLSLVCSPAPSVVLCVHYK